MRAVLDACVLYPTVLREILIGMARAGLLTPLWSERLLEEWARATARNGGAADETLARWDITRLSRDFPDARVPAEPGLAKQLWLPDENDIHVLATAVSARAEAIITLNLRDFPARELAGHGVVALHPDTFLMELWLSHPDQVADQVGSVHATAESLAEEALPLRALLKRARLPRLGKALS